MWQLPWVWILYWVGIMTEKSEWFWYWTLYWSWLVNSVWIVKIEICVSMEISKQQPPWKHPEFLVVGVKSTVKHHIRKHFVLKLLHILWKLFCIQYSIITSTQHILYCISAYQQQLNRSATVCINKAQRSYMNHNFNIIYFTTLKAYCYHSGCKEMSIH